MVDYKDFQIVEKDNKLFKSMLLPRLENNEKEYVFFSLTYLTPNYYTLYKLSKLEALNKNIHFIIVVWDTNALTHAHMSKIATDIESRQKIIDKRINELKKIILSYGISKERFTIYKSSSLWNAIIELKDDGIFIRYLGILSLVDKGIRNEKVLTKSVTHLMQSVADMFFIINFNKIFPNFKGTIPLIIVFEDRLLIYEKTKELLQKENLIEFNLPLFFIARTIPYFEYFHRAAGWDMNIDQIINLVSSYDLEEEKIEGIFQKLLYKEFDNFICYVNKERKNIKLDNFQKKMKGMSREEKQLCLALNLN